MPPFEEYLKSADTLAQEVVNAWGVHTRAGNANLLTPEFLDVFEKACIYQQAKGPADFYRSRNVLSEAHAQAEETARRTFIEAYKPWAERAAAHGPVRREFTYGVNVEPGTGSDVQQNSDFHGLTQVLTLVASSGVAAGAYNLLKAWIDAKNGRKLRLKVGDVEVEATQMDEKDVLRLLALLRENADQEKIRDLLLEAPAQSSDRQSHKGSIVE